MCIHPEDFHRKCSLVGIYRCCCVELISVESTCYSTQRELFNYLKDCPQTERILSIFAKLWYNQQIFCCWSIDCCSKSAKWQQFYWQTTFCSDIEQSLIKCPVVFIPIICHGLMLPSSIFIMLIRPDTDCPTTYKNSCWHNNVTTFSTFNHLYEL